MTRKTIFGFAFRMATLAFLVSPAFAENGCPKGKIPCSQWLAENGGGSCAHKPQGDRTCVGKHSAREPGGRRDSLGRGYYNRTR